MYLIKIKWRGKIEYGKRRTILFEGDCFNVNNNYRMHSLSVYPFLLYIPFPNFNQAAPLNCLMVMMM